MKLFELGKLAGKAPYHLSRGQKKRVALAAVMSLNPEVMIFDEPFAGLDQKSQDKLVAFLDELKVSGKTILIATHNPLVRARLADEILTLVAKILEVNKDESAIQSADKANSKCNNCTLEELAILNDLDVITLTGIDRKTFYKYKRELKSETDEWKDN